MRCPVTIVTIIHLHSVATLNSILSIWRICMFAAAKKTHRAPFILKHCPLISIIISSIVQDHHHQQHQHRRFNLTAF